MENMTRGVQLAGCVQRCGATSAKDERRGEKCRCSMDGLYGGI